MSNFCPFMSGANGKALCNHLCALWDVSNAQCAIKLAALTIAHKQ